MAMYVPNYSNGNCAVLQSNGVLRVYQTRPTPNSSVSYRDYYYSNNYYYNSGVATFSQYSTIPDCRTDITTNIYQRADFDKIMIVFICILIIFYFMAFKPIQRLFGRWLKL